MTLFESLSLVIAAGQMLTGMAGVALVWVGVRQMIRVNDARVEQMAIDREENARRHEERMKQMAQDREERAKRHEDSLKEFARQMAQDRAEVARQMAMDRARPAKLPGSEAKGA